MFRSIVVCGFLALAMPGLGAQDGPKDSAKQDFKTAGKNVGHGAKKVGHGFKRGAKKVGHGFKHGAKDVGHGFKHGAKDVGHGFTNDEEKD
jgi:hypothetical protein